MGRSCSGHKRGAKNSSLLLSCGGLIKRITCMTRYWRREGRREGRRKEPERPVMVGARKGSIGKA